MASNAKSSGSAHALNRRLSAGGLYHSMCKADRVSPAIRARKILATTRGSGATGVVETADSRVEETHSEMEMDTIGATGSTFARQARRRILLCDHRVALEPH